MSIQFEQVTKRYRGVPVVNDVTLEIAKGEFFVLLGPERQRQEHAAARRRRADPRSITGASRCTGATSPS